MDVGRRTLLTVGTLMGIGVIARGLGLGNALAKENHMKFEVVKTDKEWKVILTPEQYYVLRQEGTEAPFKNHYHNSKAAGTYHCAGCDLLLFSSEKKGSLGTSDSNQHPLLTIANLGQAPSNLRQPFLKNPSSLLATAFCPEACQSKLDCQTSGHPVQPHIVCNAFFHLKTLS